MHYSLVNWSEGMFLRPHHFQAADRYWAELAGLHASFENPCGYGVVRVEVSKEALENGVLELGGLQARMRDGTVISLGKEHLETVQIKSRIGSKYSNQLLDVFLAIPQMTDSQAVVSPKSSPPKKDSETSHKPESITRFVSFQQTLPDDCTGGDRQEVSLRQHNFRILFGSEDLSGYDLLHLMQLVVGGAGRSGFSINTRFYPPMLSIRAWTELANLLSDLRSFMGARLRNLSNVMQDRRISLQSQSYGDLSKLFLLHILNESYAELSIMATASGIHPLTAYMKLCSMYGRCSILGPELRVEDPPLYDHDNLAKIFIWICERIRTLIAAVKDDELIMRYFVGHGSSMNVVLDPSWFKPDWEWYLGVNPLAFSGKDVDPLLKRVDLKLGASEKIEEYMTYRKPGLELSLVHQLPKGLDGQGAWVFYQINSEPTHEPWRQVQLNHSIGMRFQKGQIMNADSLDGRRRLDLYLDGKTYSLEFAIFALKRVSSIR